MTIFVMVFESKTYAKNIFITNELKSLLPAGWKKIGPDAINFAK
jgi:hypothetical protein